MIVTVFWSGVVPGRIWFRVLLRARGHAEHNTLHDVGWFTLEGRQ